MATGSGRIQDRLGARWRRAGAVAALLLLGAVTGYLMTRDDGSAPAVRVLGETFSNSTTTRAPQEPAATTTAATSSALAPTPTSRPTPTTRRPGSPASTTTTSSPACRNSTDQSCGPFRWDTDLIVDQPLTLHLTVFPANPVVGQLVTFTLRASDPDAPSRGGASAIDFGEGPPIVSLLSPVLCDRYGTWSLPAPKPGAWVETYTHAYQQAGTFTASFMQTSATPDVPDCLDERLKVGDPWASTATITMPVTVSSAPT